MMSDARSSLRDLICILTRCTQRSEFDFIIVVSVEMVGWTGDANGALQTIITHFFGAQQFAFPPANCMYRQTSGGNGSDLKQLHFVRIYFWEFSKCIPATIKPTFFGQMSWTYISPYDYPCITREGYVCRVWKCDGKFRDLICKIFVLPKLLWVKFNKNVCIPMVFRSYFVKSTKYKIY